MATVVRSYGTNARMRLVRALHSAISTHLPVWSFLFAVVLCGLTFGGIAAGELKSSDTLALGNAVGQLLQAVAAHELAPASALWWQRMIADGQLLALLWLFGVSVIGLPFVVIAVFLRSFGVGFAVGFTVIQFGWRGFLLAAFGIFLHQVISMTAIVLAASIAIRFSLGLTRTGRESANLVPALIRYTAWFGVCACGLMLGAFVQAWLAGHLLSSLLVGA